MSTDKHQHALNQGDRLHWYEIESILGHGGFGITYLALDTNLNHKVAIKEYLPLQFAARDSSGEVKPVSNKQAEMFEWGKKRFLDEARTLFPFKHPNIVQVLSFFEENQTGYIVMEYVEGVDLADLIRAGEPFTEDELLGIINPIIEGLSQVHEQGFIHRDIKPRNIVIRSDGSPVLIDFGSARQALGEQTQTLTSLVTPGYSPLEQYHGASGHQGPWTDIYALGATLYAASTGRPPVDSMQRNAVLTEKKEDPYLPLVDIVGDKYSRHFLAAIDHALAFAARERPQSLSEWGVLLAADKPPAMADGSDELSIKNDILEPVLNEAVRIPSATEQSTPHSGKNRHRMILLLAVFVAVAFYTYPRWISMTDFINPEARSVLKDERSDTQEAIAAEDTSNAQAAEPEVPAVLTTESSATPDLGTVVTPKLQPRPGADINGIYGSEVTYTKNKSVYEADWYFGENQNLQVKLEQRESEVLGFIRGGREGVIKGSYAGNEVNFQFTLVDPGGNVNQGTGVWFVSRDGLRLIGTWFLRDQNGSVVLEGDWSLARAD